MMSPYHSRLSAAALLLLLMLAASTSGEASSCGALITYNQFSKVLESAPKCFQSGCGGDSLTTMSSTCASGSACFPLWRMLHQEYQQPWCQTCPGDVACRISGWPILNATTACNESPNVWLFGNGCCTNGNEPSDLSTWVQTMCNGTWRDQFKRYDGMAQPDWLQWELPWNWTVQPDNTVNPQCSSKSLYLGLFAIENIVFFLLSILYLYISLHILRPRQNPSNFVAYIKGITYPFKLLKDGIAKVFKSKNSEGGPGSVVTTTLMALLFTALQVGSNFGIAYIIKATPGYHNVPAPMLALLFCCRPRLGWLACLVVKMPDSWLTGHFRLPEGKPLMKGAKARTRVAVSAALGEVIMQILGCYFLGKTADVGRRRDFYYNNHLSPYWNGYHTRLMYTGALFWLLAGVAVTFVWLFSFIFHAQWLAIIVGTEKIAKRVTRAVVPEDPRPGTLSSWSRAPTHSVMSSTQRVQPKDEDARNLLLNEGNRREYDNPIGYEGNRREYNNPVGYEGNRRMNENEAEYMGQLPSSNTEYQNRRNDGSDISSVPDPRNDFQQLRAGEVPRPTPIMHRNGYQSVGGAPEMAEANSFRSVSLVGAGSSRGQGSNFLPYREGNVRAAASAYEPLRGNPQVRNQGSLLHPGEAQNIRRAPPEELNYEQDIGRNVRRHPSQELFFEGDNLGRNQRRDLPQRDPQHEHFIPHEDPAYLGGGEPHPVEPNVAVKVSQNHYKIYIPKDFEEWQGFILYPGVFLGFLSYIAQWLFWAGFVNASGDRFCPPDLATTGTVWTIAGALGLSFLYAAH